MHHRIRPQTRTPTASAATQAQIQRFSTIWDSSVTPSGRYPFLGSVLTPTALQAERATTAMTSPMAPTPRRVRREFALEDTGKGHLLLVRSFQKTGITLPQVTHTPCEGGH